MNDEKKIELTEDALKGLNDFHDRILKTRIAELILESEIMAIVNAKEVIAEQKAEIERLTEENAILKGNPPLVVGRSSGKTIRAKLLAFDRMKEENAELQKQVDELKAKLNEWLEDNEDLNGKIDFGIAMIELIGVKSLDGEVIAESLIDEICKEITEGKVKD